MKINTDWLNKNVYQSVPERLSNSCCVTQPLKLTLADFQSVCFYSIPAPSQTVRQAIVMPYGETGGQNQP